MSGSAPETGPARKKKREARALREKYTRLYAEDMQRRQNTRGPAGSWSGQYPVHKRDLAQRIIDPLVDNRVFQGAVFLIILYSIWNLIESYLAETPVELAQVSRVSFVISAIFMVEFLLKFLSRRLRYLKREGVVDFLAASDFFSPALRATKFVRFLRVLRVMRMVRGVRMTHKGSTRIEDNLFSTFSAATIVVMLAFISAWSIYSWRARKTYVHESLMPILLRAESHLEFADSGGLASRSNERAARQILASLPGFVEVVHRDARSLGSAADWDYHIKRELNINQVRAVAQKIRDLAENAGSGAGRSVRGFLTGHLQELVTETPTIRSFYQARNDLYIRRQRTDDAEALRLLDEASVLLESVQPLILPLGSDEAREEHLQDLRQEHFEESFLQVRRSVPGGRMEYTLLISEEYERVRNEELAMILAVFVLVIVMVLTLNYAVSDIIQPLAELHGRMRDVIETGKFVPIRYAVPPENEFEDIAENVNNVIRKLLVGNNTSIETFR